MADHQGMADSSGNQCCIWCHLSRRFFYHALYRADLYNRSYLGLHFLLTGYGSIVHFNTLQVIYKAGY